MSDEPAPPQESEPPKERALRAQVADLKTRALELEAENASLIAKALSRYATYDAELSSVRNELAKHLLLVADAKRATAATRRAQAPKPRQVDAPPDKG